ncbi:hypothetical protein HDU84_008229 [Entophlyctis sp. JEL0112]|nr:hypothetical protein HDU84_008229 [Entophlyctis sp. JEL0112]
MDYFETLNNVHVLMDIPGANSQGECRRRTDIEVEVLDGGKEIQIQGTVTNAEKVTVSANCKDLPPIFRRNGHRVLLSPKRLKEIPDVFGARSRWELKLSLQIQKLLY